MGVHRSGGKWTQQSEKLTGVGETGEGNLGWSVALASEGNTAIAGAPYVYSGSAPGAAWVFTRSAEKWSQQEKLTGSGETGNGDFGWSVALASEGNTALVGAPFDNSGPGAVWTYTRSGVKWSQLGSKLVGAGGFAGFGYAVVLSPAGSTAIVGSPYEDAVTTFARVGEGWTQQGEQLFVASGPGGGQAGLSLALSANGNMLLVGGEIEGAGAMWAFTRTGTTWTQQGAGFQGFGEYGEGEEEGGNSVAISSNGGTALLGYGEESYAAPGAAWVYVNTPTVTTGAASQPTETSATVEATVNPNGVPVGECAFEYGPTSSYGSSVACSVSPGSGVTAAPVSASVTGLSPNTLYHFRISARNESGVSVGEDETFTTPETSKFKSTGSPSEPATATDGQLTATASGGIGTVTVGHYAGNPVSATPFTSTGDFTDVSLECGEQLHKTRIQGLRTKGRYRAVVVQSCPPLGATVRSAGGIQRIARMLHREDHRSDDAESRADVGYRDRCGDPGATPRRSP